MSALEFQLNLTGNFAAALRPVTEGLKGAGSEAKKTKEDLHLVEGELGKLKGSVGGVSFDLNALFKGGGGVLSFDLAEMATKAGEVVVEVYKKIAEAAFELGKELIKTSAAAQDLNLAVRLDVGEEQAKGISELADSFANTRFDDDVIKRFLLPLLEQGVTDQRLLDDLATAATDIAARRNQGAEGVQAALGAFSKIAFKGEVDGRVLREIAVSERAFYEDLGGLLKTSAKEAEALTKAGKVSRETLLSVALNQVAQREGGALGKASLEAGKTLGATLERLGNLPENLMKQFADSPAVARIQGILDNFIATLQGPAGQQAIAAIGDILESLTQAFAGAAGPDGLRGFASAVGGAVSAMRELVAIFRASGNAAAYVWEKINDLSSLVFKLGLGAAGGAAIADMIGDPKKLVDAATKLGGAGAEGVERGARGGAARVQVAGANLGAAMLEGTAERTETRSPSRAMARLGAFAAEGYAAGIEQGAPSVDSAARRALADTVMGVRANSGAATRAMSISASFGDIVIQTAATTAQGIATEAAQVVRAELQRVLEEVAYAAGDSMAVAA